MRNLNKPMGIPSHFNKTFQQPTRNPIVKGRVKRGYTQKSNATNMKRLTRTQRGK